METVNKEELRTLTAAGAYNEAFELLTEPLHEELYRQQNFDFLTRIKIGQRLLLSYDYVRMQVLQGGFIQFIQNGYISLLLHVIEGLQHFEKEPEMVSLLDDVLKVYVLNIDTLGREASLEEFSKMYEEFKEFEILDERFGILNDGCIRKMLRMAEERPEELLFGDGL